MTLSFVRLELENKIEEIAAAHYKNRNNLVETFGYHA